MATQPLITRQRADRKSSRGSRGPSAAQRLNKALAVLIDRAPDGAGRRNATAAEVCRIAGVSRNSLYRYHPSVVQALHQYQQKHSDTRAAARSKPDSALKSEIAAMREQLVKLTALVDHYYSAYREINDLLQRRERELADLRRRLDSKPIVLQR